jgi:hypothetical protein
MSKTYKTRKLPKKTVFLISMMTVIGIVGFLFITTTKNMKMEEVLATLEHKNIKDIKVVNRLNAEDKKTKIQNTVYKVSFTDKDLNKECIGFVIRSNHGKYSKDIDCK